MRKKLCNEFSRGFSFFFFFFDFHTQFSAFQCSCRGFLFFFAVAHTDTQKAHRWKIIRKINLFSDGFYFVCCFSSLFSFQNQYSTLLCHIFHFFLMFYLFLMHTQMLEQALADDSFLAQVL